MKSEEFPDSARRAFDLYPQIEPSMAFNRAVLDALASEQNKRKQTFIGRIEEFLGVGLWGFAASGALGAFVPAAILGMMMMSDSTSQKTPMRPMVPSSMAPYAGPYYAREWEQLAAPVAATSGKEVSCFVSKFPLA